MDAIYIDAIWLGFAFLSGLVMKQLGLPTLIGFLATGFFLNYAGLAEGNLKDIIGSLSDLGITLLLFIIGLKIKFKSLVQKEILITASAHMLISILAFASLVFLMGYTGLRLFSGLSIYSALAIGFALSFSSTVFVVKTLEDRGEMTARHGKLAIGILIIQDIFAVIFITLTNDTVPSIWALTLPLYLYVVRFLLNPLLRRSGHGEMLTVFGFFAPLILGSLAFDL
jgi:glutathione-regulated potassium-efflux system ancillary protein KefC